MTDLIKRQQFKLTEECKNNLLKNVGLDESLFAEFENDTAHYLNEVELAKKKLSPAEAVKKSDDIISCINELLFHLNETDSFFVETLLMFDEGLPTRQKVDLTNRLEGYLQVLKKARESFRKQKKDGRAKDWGVRIWVSAIKRTLVKNGVELGKNHSILVRTVKYIAESLPPDSPTLNPTRMVNQLYGQDKII